VTPTMPASSESGRIEVRGRGTTSPVRRFLFGRATVVPGGVFLGAAAVLMVASGLIHLHLWDIAYRHIATLGPLFLVQAVAAIVLAVAVAGTRQGLFLVAALGLMAGTIGGFILVTTVGLFGFTLHVITGWADAALATETAAIVALLVAVVLLWRSTRSIDRPATA
jgi:hypothetical protein